MAMQSIKLVMVGDGATGKTCLLISYTSNSFPIEYVPTVFDNYSANVSIDGSVVCLGLWDTGGGEDYGRLRPLSYPQTDVFVLCYSVVNSPSFENCIAMWLPEVNHHCPSTPVILCGTKEDLLWDEEWLRQKGDSLHLVPKEKADALVGRFNIVAHVYTSSLCMLGVREVFELAVRTVISPTKSDTNQKSSDGSSKGIMSLFSSKPKLAPSVVSCVTPPPIYLTGRVGVSVMQTAWTDALFIGGLGKDGKYESEPLIAVSMADARPMSRPLLLRDAEKQLLQRNFAGCCVGRANGWIIGGKAGRYMNDVVEISLHAPHPIRVLTVAPGAAPSPRYGHSVVFIEGELYLFGGYTNESAPSNELWKLVFYPTCHWVPLTSSVGGKKDAVIAPRYHHAAVYNAGTMYVFGGNVDGKPTNELLVYDLNYIRSGWSPRWMIAKVTGAELPPAIGASMVVSSPDIIVLAAGRLFRLHDKSVVYNDVNDPYPCQISIKCDEIKLNTKLSHHTHTSMVLTSQLYLFGGMTVPDEEWTRIITLQYVIMTLYRKTAPTSSAFAVKHLQNLPKPVSDDIKILKLYFEAYMTEPIQVGGRFLSGGKLIDWQKNSVENSHRAMLRDPVSNVLAFDGGRVLYAQAYQRKTARVWLGQFNDDGFTRTVVEEVKCNYKGITLFKLPNDRVLRFLNNNHGYEANLNHNTRDRAARFADVCVLGVASGTVWNLLGNLNDGTNIQVAVVDSMIVAAHHGEQRGKNLITRYLWDSNELGIGVEIIPKCLASHNDWSGQVSMRKLLFNGYEYLVEYIYSQSQCLLAVWDPKKIQFPGLVAPLDASHVPPLHQGRADWNVVQLDSHHFALYGGSITTIWQFNEAEAKLACSSLLREELRSIYVLNSTHYLGVTRATVKKFATNNNAAIWSQPFDGLLHTIIAPYSFADTVGTTALLERRNRHSYFSLLPEELVKMSMTYFGAREFNVGAITGGTQMLFVHASHGLYQVTIA